ncbi:NAC domain containing protein 50-like [Solanum pennellii]|uniref:NAC domain containing protein 50-like n=1 Tax=Solanum pennellii TaxID=28526 RepID=A0ABM1GBL7_SOLPN|nr:NAC domain containing protein 50-like [Solanum pennellii]
MSKQMGIRFHPTDTELINYLKRFFKGELSLNQQCPIQFADIYGDQPPWEIFGANSKEKFHYFITPLKKRKIKDKRFCRTCVKGTWKGQTAEDLIRRNSMGPVVGFKRNFRFETSECGQNKTWLMIEYRVADSFFKENNHIVKEDFVVCRIKKKKDVDHHVMDAEDGGVAGVIDPMLLLEPNHNNDYSTTELDQVRVCEATTLDYDVQNSSTMENRETTLEVEESDRVDGIRSDEDMCRMLEDILDVDIPNVIDDIKSDEDMYRMFEDIVVGIPDDWLEDSLV